MTKQVICFDLRCLQIGHENRGIGMHARSIIENLDASRDYSYIFYLFEGSNPISDLPIKCPADFTVIYTPKLSTSISRPSHILDVLRLTLHSFKSLRNIHFDIFVQFDFNLGLPPASKHLTRFLVAYDLIPLLFKEEYLPAPHKEFLRASGISRVKRFIRACYYRIKQRYTYSRYNKADHIISISNTTKASLMKHLSIPSYKISTVHLAPVSSNKRAAQKPKNLTLKKNDPFIFYIGATDSRKRVSDLITAFGRLREQNQHLKLLLAGKELADKDTIENQEILMAYKECSYKKDVLFLGFVSDEEKSWLYDNALCFVFPTTYEGFGLPLIEAMHSRCPVVSYDNSSIREVTNKHILLVKTGDITQLQLAIYECINNNKAYAPMIRKAYAFSQQFTWKKHMKQLYLLFQQEKKG